MFTISFSYATMITLAFFGLLLFMLLVIVLGTIFLRGNRLIGQRDYRPRKSRPMQASQLDYHQELTPTISRQLPVTSALSISDVIDGEWKEIR